MQDLALYLPGFLIGYGIFLVAMLSPGPNILTIIGTSMSTGRSAGMALAFGTAVGSFGWALLSIAGLTAIIATHVWVFTAVKIIGGLYLLWLAYKSFLSATKDQDMTIKPLKGKATHARYFWRGFTVQMTNAKAAIFWVAMMSVAFKDGAPVSVMLIFGIGVFFMSFVLHQLYAVAFSTNVMVKTYTKARRPLQAMLGSFFIFAGFKLLLSRT